MQGSPEKVAQKKENTQISTKFNPSYQPYKIHKSLNVNL